MPQDKPAEWAMKAARGTYIAFGNGIETLTTVVASAIEAAANAATERERERLNTMPLNWELSCENEDTSDISSDLVWVIYAVNGGLNEREWEKIGQGDTPSNAISAAFLAAAIRKGGDND